MRRKDRLIIIIALVVAVAVLLLCWFLLVPNIEKLSVTVTQKESERQALSTQVDTLKVAKNMIDNGGSTVNGGMPVSLADLEKIIPPAQEVEDWYAMVENMAKNAQITDPISVNVGEITGTGIGAVPLTVSASGSYDNIVAFIKDFQNALRPMNITGINIISRDDGGVAADIKAIAYVSGATGTEGNGAAPMTGADSTNALQASADMNTTFNGNSASQ